MDRATVQQLLPCYVCGDLPPEVGAQVAAVVAQDADLQARVDHLRGSRHACREALAAVAPDLDLDLPRDRVVTAPVDPPVPAAPSGLPGALLALVACAMILLGVVRAQRDVPPEVALADTLVMDTRAAPLHTGPTPRAIVDALLADGAVPRLALVPDLSHLGFTLVGARVVDGPRGGVVVIYEKDGQRYACQMFTGFRTHTRPDRVAQAGGLTLRGFARPEGGGVVEWTGGGMTCLFSGPVPVDALLASVARRFTPAG